MSIESPSKEMFSVKEWFLLQLCVICISYECVPIFFVSLQKLKLTL